jgi:uncharacterized membrane protein YhaH (DUF805 family)
LRSGIGGIARFSGRDPRRLFWPYAGTVLGLALLAWMIAFSLLLEGAFPRLQRFARENPELVAESARGDLSVRSDYPGLLLDPARFLLPMMMIFAIIVLLLAAAIVRRLHDRNRSGAWGLLPLPFLLIGLAAMPAMFGDDAGTRLALLPWLFLSNVAYLASLGILVAMLVRKGNPGANRYGPDPDARGS